jgi:putative addiction module component (TIGR02574 family)
LHTKIDKCQRFKFASILEQQEELPLSSAQQQELERRLENYEKNPRNGSSWEEVKNRFR